MDNLIFNNLVSILSSTPRAAAILKGNTGHPNLRGVILFYSTEQGVLVATQVTGLPKGLTSCGKPIFGFHIHSGEQCSGNSEDPFADVGTHLNPRNCPHPFHAGDMPPLFGVGGNAISIFLTDRFNVEEILGKTVIIHSNADDFTTQPAGNSGTKIACGEILPLRSQEDRF